MSSKTTTVSKARKTAKTPVKAAKKSAPKSTGKRIKPRQAGKQTAKKAGLFRFQFTPSGKMLRAYFISLIAQQTGVNASDKLKAGAQFNLWAGGSFSGHVATGKLVRHGGTLHSLSNSGVTYFTSEQQRPLPELFDAFTDAVKSGKAPKCHPHEMVALIKS